MVAAESQQAPEEAPRAAVAVGASTGGGESDESGYNSPPPSRGDEVAELSAHLSSSAHVSKRSVPSPDRRGPPPPKREKQDQNELGFDSSDSDNGGDDGGDGMEDDNDSFACTKCGFEWNSLSELRGQRNPRCVACGGRVLLPEEAPPPGAAHSRSVRGLSDHLQSGRADFAPSTVPRASGL